MHLVEDKSPALAFRLRCPSAAPAARGGEDLVQRAGLSSVRAAFGAGS